MLANEEDAKDVFGIEAENTDINSGKLDKDGYVSVAKQLTGKFGFKAVAITLRESKSASDNDWSGMLFKNGNAFFQQKIFDAHRGQSRRRRQLRSGAYILAFKRIRRAVGNRVCRWRQVV